MADLRLLADMNISPVTVAALRSQGIDVVRVSDLLPVNTTDEDLLEFARSENRAVVTHDLDFSALVALRGHSQPSVVTLRLSKADPTAVAKRLLEILPRVEADLAQGCAATVDDGSVRIRKLPIQ